MDVKIASSKFLFELKRPPPILNPKIKSPRILLMLGSLRGVIFSTSLLCRQYYKHYVTSNVTTSQQFGDSCPGVIYSKLEIRS